MRKYETIIIFDPLLTEGDLKSEITKVEGIIKEVAGANAKTLSVDNWGKKELPFKVKKFKHGHFVRYEYDLEDPLKAEQLPNTLRITDKVIRFQTHLMNTPKRKIKVNPKRKESPDLQEFYSQDLDY